MGFSFTLDNTPSLALGTAEASIKEVAEAYSSFANGGYLIRSRSITSIQTPGGEVIFRNEFPAPDNRIMDEKTSLLMGAMLQKAIREGTGNSLKSVYGVSFQLAGKTRTSQNYADAWFAAFNPRLVIVSRVGASTAAIHFNSGKYGSGSALALPLVALTLKKAQQDPELRGRIIARFPDLPTDLQHALDCPDFKEDNIFNRIIDVSGKERRTYDEKEKNIEKKIRDFFRKIIKKEP